MWPIGWPTLNPTVTPITFPLDYPFGLVFLTTSWHLVAFLGKAHFLFLEFIAGPSFAHLLESADSLLEAIAKTLHANYHFCERRERQASTFGNPAFDIWLASEFILKIEPTD